jgi:hypothetical protein
MLCKTADEIHRRRSIWGIAGIRMISDTIVFQSFRTDRVPGWISRCLESARRWAGMRGFEYLFLDDRFFDFIPADLRARTANKVILSDLARLLVSRDLLCKGHRRLVWIDADVVVFDPDRWQVPDESDYYFTHELWPTPHPGGVRLDVRANNAVMVFSRNCAVLDFYIDMAKRILLSEPELKNWHLGVRFLTGLRNVCPLPVLPNIAMLGPDLIKDLLRGPKQLTSAYVRAMGEPLVAANLCASYAGSTIEDLTLTDAVMDEITNSLVETRGQALNQFLAPPVQRA